MKKMLFRDVPHERKFVLGMKIFVRLSSPIKFTDMRPMRLFGEERAINAAREDGMLASIDEKQEVEIHENHE